MTEKMRVGTTGSRFRDCAGLMSYGYLLALLNMGNVSSLLEWVFVETIAKDINRMMQEDEKLDTQFSYFPYQSGPRACVEVVILCIGEFQIFSMGPFYRGPTARVEIHERAPNFGE